MQNIWKKSAVGVSGMVMVMLLIYCYAIPAGLWRPGIVVSVQQQQTLIENFERSWLRPPSDEEREDILNSFIQRELAYREASRLELGHDDVDIRRRLQHKLESLAEDEAAKQPPTQQELQSFLDQNANQFRVDPILSFRQIYFDNSNNTIGADASARFMLGKLRSQDMPDDISDLGDTSSLPAYVEKKHESEIRALFGSEFSTALASAVTGQWVGPIHSDSGIHIVFVDDRTEGRLPNLDEFEDAVRQQWLATKKLEAVENLYKQLAEDYRVTIE